MLSGIGPKEHLKSLDIETIVDSPVGENIEDHLTFFGLPIIVNDGALKITDILNLKSFDLYNYNGSYHFSTIGTVEGLGYIRTNQAEDEYADIELVQTYGFLTSDAGFVFGPSWGIDRGFFKKFFASLIFQNVIGIIPEILLPRSKGYMRLKSKNPFEAPLFYGQYLTDPDGKDLKTMIEAIKFVLELIKTKPFKDIGAKLSPIKVPGCELKEGDDYWECAIRTITVSSDHQLGPCRMGKDSKNSVTNSKGEVWGVKNLRVADLSILPKSVRAHTYCVTVMIGEKISNFIKDKYRI